MTMMTKTKAKTPSAVDEREYFEALALVSELQRRGIEPDPELVYELQIREMVRRGRFPFLSFWDYVEYVNPTLLQYEHVPKLINTADEVVRGEITNLMVMMPTRYFKALDDETPIPTPTGWTRMGDLKAGDEVFAGDGTVTKVLGVQKWGERPVYRVSTADGAWVRASGDHKWLVRKLNAADEWAVKHTDELLEGDWEIPGTLVRPHYPEGASYPTNERPRPLTIEPDGTAEVTCIAVEHPSQLFLAGEGLMVTHNTEIFARLLASYYLRKFPERNVGIASYNASRVWEVSEDARNYYEQSFGALREGAKAKKFWGPVEGGQLWAVGVGEGTLGRGYHLGICDDPTDPEKAISPTYQKRFQRWWPEKFLSRREWGPNSATILVMQRLGMDDPIDWLFRREVGENTEKAPMNWHVLVMDEIKSDEPLGRWDGPQGLPPTCTLIEDPRNPGEVLAPSRLNLDQVLQIHQASGSLTTAAQRQQRPFRPSGDFWLERWFRSYDRLPADAYNGGMDWDTAYSANEQNSASAMIHSFRGPGPDGEFPIYIEEVWWDWLKYPELIAMMKSKDGPHYVEGKASGKSAVQSLASNLVTAEEVPVKGSKLERASQVQPTVAAGRVYVRKDILHTLLYGEGQGLLRVTAEALAAETGGLDVNDTFVQAITRHLRLHEGVRPSVKVW